MGIGNSSMPTKKRLLGKSRLKTIIVSILFALILFVLSGLMMHDVYNADLVRQQEESYAVLLKNTVNGMEEWLAGRLSELQFAATTDQIQSTDTEKQIASIDSRALLDKFLNKLNLPAGGFTLLIDQYGRIIQSPQPADIGKKIEESNFSASMKQLLSDKLNAEGTHIYRDNEKKFFLAYSSVSPAGFTLFLQIPEDALYPRDSNFNLGLFAFIFGIAIISVLIFYARLSGSFTEGLTKDVLQRKIEVVPRKIWLMLSAIYVLPAVYEAVSRTDMDYIWIMYVIPSLIFSYYFGLNGGLFNAFISAFILLMIEAYEYYIDDDSITLLSGVTFFVVTVVNFLVAIGTGMLAEKLRSKQLELMSANEKLNAIALTDEMTGVFNRRGFFQRAQQMLKGNSHAAVLFLDIVGFKRINDSLGHEIGDRVLREVSSRIAECIGAKDVLSCFGGDEFVLLLSGSSKQEAVPMVERLIAKLCDTVVIDGHEINVRLSIGVSEIPGDDANLEKVVQYADIAMYQVNKQGKNSYQFYNDQMGQALKREIEIDKGLKQAIKRQELEVYYQPKVDLRSGEIFSVEALLRWNHPQLGEVSPTEFIPIAERNGQIFPIFEWVLRQACSQIQELNLRGASPVQLAVNLSVVQLNDRNLPAIIKRILQETEFPPQRLQLEVTENIFMENVHENIIRLNEIKALGIQFAIDDFGTGYSSLSYLHHLPVDALKIDKSFIREIDCAANRAIVRTVIDLANNLGLEVVAEGVETREQMELLKTLNCYYVQGYYFCSPVPFADLSKKMTHRAVLR